MLHVHSYNMGLAAGLAWKAAGKDEFTMNEASENEAEFMMEILEISINLDMFLPSSFMEGFHNAFSHSKFRFINSVNTVN